MRFPPYAPLTNPHNPLKRLFWCSGCRGFQEKRGEINKQESLVLHSSWRRASNKSLISFCSEEAFARFFYYFGLRPHIWGASECAPLSLSAKKLVCLVRFSRATSALEPPTIAAVLLPSAALSQLLCSTKLPAYRFLSLKPFLLKQKKYDGSAQALHNDRCKAIVCGRGIVAVQRGRQTKARCAIVLREIAIPLAPLT